ncbi:hypothetical protein [Actinoplanes sp. GCM10030250]|uniref:hypothetical protein n=1 Tax=Actinoplanes sp. GCM10030250 TaxID=3273376 RepID=UPI00360827C0
MRVFDAAAGTLVPSPYYNEPLKPQMCEGAAGFADISGRGSLLTSRDGLHCVTERRRTDRQT